MDCRACVCREAFLEGGWAGRFYELPSCATLEKCAVESTWKGLGDRGLETT